MEKPQKTSNIQQASLPDGLNSKVHLTFDKFSNKLKVPYVIYADFECLNRPTEDSLPTSTTYTHEYAEHKPSGFSLCVVDSSKKNLICKEVYRGESCVEVFFERIIEHSKRLLKCLREIVPLFPLTSKQFKEFSNAKFCHICEKEFLNPYNKVIDHDHQTGLYRGPAHSDCNINFKHKKKIPIVFHNFRGYDSHLIIHGFEKFKGKVNIIPTNSEKYLSIICDNFYFLDSMMFLNASLDSLVQNLHSKNDFKGSFLYLIEAMGEKKAKLLSRKGVYCYDYINSFSKFKEKKFPSSDAFINSLTGENVSVEDYNYGKMIFTKYCETLGDYHDIYLQTDTALLACVFENFRDLSIETYQLDPLHYFSLAGLAWEASLEFSN